MCRLSDCLCIVYTDSILTSRPHRRRGGYPKDQKLWDSFQDPPAPQSDGSLAENQRFNTSKKWMKAFAYLFVFAVTLFTGVVSKLSFVLMVANVRGTTNTTYCDFQCR